MESVNVWSDRADDNQKSPWTGQVGVLHFLKCAGDPPADVPHHVAVSRLNRRHGAVVGVGPPTFYASGHG